MMLVWIVVALMLKSVEMEKLWVGDLVERCEELGQLLNCTTLEMEVEVYGQFPATLEAILFNSQATSPRLSCSNLSSASRLLLNYRMCAKPPSRGLCYEVVCEKVYEKGQPSSIRVPVAVTLTSLIFISLLSLVCYCGWKKYNNYKALEETGLSVVYRDGEVEVRGLRMVEDDAEYVSGLYSESRIDEVSSDTILPLASSTPLKA